MEKVHINVYMKNLSGDDIEKSINVFLKWQKTGKWISINTPIHEIYRIYYKPVGAPEIQGILEAYSNITHELAQRLVFQKFKFTEI